MSADYKSLTEKARDIRIDIIKSLYHAGSGHPGGSLSVAEIMTFLYYVEMNVDPGDPGIEGRDKFVLSKGHAAPALYATLAEKGFFPKEKLNTIRKLGGDFQGHPDMLRVPGVEMSTGSLGQGFSTAVGMALAGKLDKSKSRVYVLLGDGELQEGIVWEAAMSAAHYKLDDLCAIVDWNGLQIDGNTDEVMKVTPIAEKFKAFGFSTHEIDGHSFGNIEDALSEAKLIKKKPSVIIAKTIKGKGVSFMENNASWHGKAPAEDEARKAVEELGGEW